MRERKIESKTFEQSERKKKKKKRSDHRFRMMMMMFFFSPAISRSPRKTQLSGERKRTKREEKRRRSLSFVRSLSNARSFREESTHLIIFWRPWNVGVYSIISSRFWWWGKREEVRAPRHFFLNSIDDFAFKNTRFVQTYTSRPRLVSHRAWSRVYTFRATSITFGFFQKLL